MPKERHWTIDDLSELRALREMRWPHKSIGERLGRTSQAIRRKCFKIDNEPPSAVTHTPAENERLVKRIRRLMAAYPSACAFERESGIARATLHRIFKGQSVVFASTLRVIDEMSAEYEKAPREIAKRPT